MSTAISFIEELQALLVRAGYSNVHVDGDIGQITLAAIHDLDERGDKESLDALKASGNPPPGADKHHTGKASFFAGPQDIAAFRQCKSNGNSDVYCFGLGDNGIGKWGRDCTSRMSPIAALPREIWRDAGKTGGARLWVEYNGKRVEGELWDTMPSLENITNGAIIDLNPGFAVQFGVSPDRMNNSTLSPVTWGWVD